MSQTDIVERLRDDANYIHLAINDQRKAEISNGDKGIIVGQLFRDSAMLEWEAADTITQLRERLDEVEKERDQLRLSNERMRERAAVVVKDIDVLVENSSGVIGLHLNGDEAPWTELLAGGKYEDWLVSVELLRAALTAESGTEVEG